MAMMSNEGEKKCPLCAEEMDWTDQQLKPCKCGYEVCVWCWNHIMDMAEKDETEGRCPACRAPYDKEKVVGMEAKCERLVTKKEREIKLPKPKPKKQEEKKDLSNVRVIQRKMAYVIGLPLSLADEDLLQRKDYFGQYGNVCKISLSRTAGGAVQQFINDTCSVYITYSKEEEAIRCIQSVHGFLLEGRSLRASFGTAKYCHVWLRNMLCNNPACLYLHAFGADEDSFGKDEEAAVNTRNRVHQIVGATHNMQQRSGMLLPPPSDGPINISCIAADRLNPYSMKRESISNGHLTCSMSSKDQNGRIKIPNRSFLDVVAQPSSASELGNITEDWKLLSVCSDFSIVVTDENYQDTEHSDGMPSEVSSIGQSPTTVLDKDSQQYTENSYIEPESHHLPMPANGFTETKTRSHSDSEIKIKSSTSFSNKEIVGQLRRLDGHNLTNNSGSSALSAVESNIVSSILSLDFDSFDDSLSLPQNFAERYGGSGATHVSLCNSTKSDRSRFSFAKEESYAKEANNFSDIDQGSKRYSLFSDSVGKDSMEKENIFSSGPQISGFRTQSSVPPGFSVAPRDAPPGFSSYERTNQLQPASSGSYSVDTVSYSNNHCFAPPHGHTRSVSDIDFSDPAIMVVRGSQSTPQNTTYNDEARLWLLMQQAEAAHRGTQFAPYLHQEPQFSASNVDRFTTTGNSDGFNSWLPADQSQAYTPSLYNTQLSQQKYINGHMSNGHWSMLNGDLGAPEVQRNDRLRFDKFFSGHTDLMYHMPSTGDIYNRVYGL